MTKKKKPAKQPEKKSNKNFIIIAVIALIAVIAFAGLQLRQTSDKTSVPSADDQSLRKGETRRTLSPSQFSDPYIAAMYQVARDIPHVLDSVKCYCFCDRSPFNHKSLLSCYVDTHAAG